MSDRCSDTAHERHRTRPGPYFSIVIAVRNRGHVIMRCLNSILSQDFRDFEVLAVDDCSEDDTVDVMRGVDDPRLRIVEAKEHAGMWGARCLGIEAARGEWIIWFDSDDALVEGALSTFHERALLAPPEVGIIGASYRDDQGQITPDPPLPSGPFGLMECVKWLNEMVRADYIHVVRRAVLDEVPFPPPKGHGSLFELRVLERWRKDVSRDVLGLIYTDCTNRFSGKRSVFRADFVKAVSSQRAEVYEQMDREYGALLREHAPRRYVDVQRSAALMHFLAGHRWRGACRLLRYLARKPLALKGWSTLFFGLLGPRALNWARRNLA